MGHEVEHIRVPGQAQLERVVKELGDDYESAQLMGMMVRDLGDGNASKIARYEKDPELSPMFSAVRDWTDGSPGAYWLLKLDRRFERLEWTLGAVDGNRPFESEFAKWCVRESNP